MSNPVVPPSTDPPTESQAPDPDPSPDPNPALTAFNTAQQTIIHELHAAITRGRNTINQSIKTLEEQQHDADEYLKLYKQLGVLNMWEKSFDSVWKQMENVRPRQMATFLVAKEKGLRCIAEKFREMIEGVGKEVDGGGE